MKVQYYIFLLLFFIQCSNVGKMGTDIYSSSVEEDTRILDQAIGQLSEERHLPPGELMIKAGMFFMGTPYVGGTLEQDGEERLVVNLRELDCTTFAETCLALTNTVRSSNPGPEQYVRELTRVRYRDSRINGYTSRLHYTTDWIYNNQQKDLVRDVTRDIVEEPYEKQINFMSTHPGSYRHLKGDNDLTGRIAEIEAEISERPRFYIPKDKEKEMNEHLRDGDIVALTTSINGLDVSHMGIVVRKGNKAHLLHASLTAKKVVLSEETLYEYLQNSKTVTGIIVARPQ